MSEQNQRPTVSASRISSYAICGHAYKKRYIDKDIRPGMVSMVKGNIFHALAKENNTQKIDSRIDLDLDYMQDFVAETTDKTFQDEIMLTGEDKTKGKAIVADQVKTLLIATAETYKRETAIVQPRIVEKAETLVLPNYTSDLRYVMDCETEDDQIIDYKFSAKKKNQGDVDTNLGLTAYAMSFVVRHKKFPSKISFHNYGAYRTPAKQELKTFFNPLYTARDTVDFQNFLERSVEMLKAIDAGIFMPAPVGSWKCCPAYCEYFSDCKYVNAARKAAADQGE